MVEQRAPDPTPAVASGVASPALSLVEAPLGHDPSNPSVVHVTIAGCGGCGINLARPFADDHSAAKVLFFDTSLTNSRHGEQVNVLTNGNGSGSLRSENARDIEREIAQLPDDEMGKSDVAVVMFSAAGGSGSVIGPLMVREYSRRQGMRVIAVVVADTSSSTGAKNTINTLKTLTAIANNAGLYLPIILLSNDQDKGRRGADQASQAIVKDLVELLTESVYEVDRNDRMNWIDPAKVVGAKPGLKLMMLESDAGPHDPAVVIGIDTGEMVDSTLIVQDTDEDNLPGGRPLTRLKKVGFFYGKHRPIVGKVTGDIKAIDAIIDSVERVEQIDKSQRYDQVDRLKSSGNDDLIL